MIILLSPSKTQDYDDALQCGQSTKPALWKESLGLVEVLKKQSKSQLKKTLSVSDKLAALNHERYQDFSSKLTDKNARQALLAFRGDVYQGFELEEYKKADYTFAQKHLRIISGLYGLLKPLDLIQPYRLEMKTKLKNPRGKDLYEYWGDLLSKTLNKDLKDAKSKVVINLASNEYSKSLVRDVVTQPVVDIHFKEKKGNSYKTVGIYAKQARGQMANWLIRNKLTSLNDIKKFKKMGYTYKSSMSEEYVFTFIR